MKCPSCGNKARPGYYEQQFVDHGILEAGLRIWQCRSCGEALTHGFLTRSRLAPEHIRQQLAMGWSEPASMGELEDMAAAMPDQVASGGLELQLDRLRANLAHVSTDGLDAFEQMIGSIPVGRRASPSCARSARVERGPPSRRSSASPRCAA
jgi:ribosomal protein L37AE/L43A